MGSMPIFYKIKKKENIYKNGDIISAEEGEIILLTSKQDFKLNSIIWDIYGTNGEQDLLIIDHKTFIKILEQYRKEVKEEKEYLYWEHFIAEELGLINELFDFSNYYLGYCYI